VSVPGVSAVGDFSILSFWVTIYGGPYIDTVNLGDLVSGWSYSGLNSLYTNPSPSDPGAPSGVQATWAGAAAGTWQARSFSNAAGVGYDTTGWRLYAQFCRIA
jgi:hypothetical protein